MTLMPSGDLRRALRGHGHAMSAIVQIGKSGVTDGVIKQVHQALADHELIKVKIGGECPIDRTEVAARLDREPGIEVVQLVGRVLLLYKRHPRTPRYDSKGALADKRVSASKGERPVAGGSRPAPGTSRGRPARRTSRGPETSRGRQAPETKRGRR
jgi:RNA-binding protein